MSEAKRVLSENQALIEKLKAENAALKKQEAYAFSIKQAEKSGKASVYGMGRFPVTLGRKQWQSLADNMPKILAFLASNPDCK